MKDFLLFAVRTHPVVSAAAALFLALALILVGDAAAEAVYFALPANNDRPLELWMSPRFVGQSWDLPRPIIFDIMQIDDSAGPEGYPHTLAEVLERTGLTLADLQNRVEAAEAEMKAQRAGR